MPTWRGPTYPVKTGLPYDIWWETTAKSKTVVKFQGAWRTLVSPTEDFLATCEVVLRGGYVIPITDELSTELITAGFSENITGD